MIHFPGLSYSDFRNTFSVRIEFKNTFLTFISFLFQAKNKEPEYLLNKLTENSYKVWEVPDQPSSRQVPLH